MLSVYLNASRDGINRTHKDFAAPIFFPSRRNQANWGWILGGGVILEPEKPGGVAGRRPYGKCGLTVIEGDRRDCREWNVGVDSNVHRVTRWNRPCLLRADDVHRPPSRNRDCRPGLESGRYPACAARCCKETVRETL